MSENKTRMPLADARSVAEALVALLRPACERIEIVGSVRRGKPTVGDIEILAVPREETPLDLFGATVAVGLDQLEECITGLVLSGAIDPRQVNGRGAWGPRYKRLAFRGAPVDLFACTADEWGVACLIRTGPAEFSHRFVTDRRHGGCMPEWAHVQGNRIRVRASGAAVPTPEEQDCFDFAGLKWLPPERRELTEFPARVGLGAEVRDGR